MSSHSDHDDDVDHNTDDEHDLDEHSSRPQRSGAPTQPAGGAGGHDDEDEFEFEHYSAGTGGAGASSAASKGPLKKTLDKPFDEVHEVSDSADSSHADISPGTSPTGKHQQQHHRSVQAAHAAAATSNPNAKQQQQQQQQQSFDEDDESAASLDSPPAKKKSKHHKKEKEKKSSKSSSSSSSVHQGKPGNMAMSGKPGNVAASSAPKEPQQRQSGSSDEESESDGEDVVAASTDGGAAQSSPSKVGLYNPADYSHLVVTSEIQGLFEYITRHKPLDIELETQLKPFIPDYIPAVGEIDAFLKVPPPNVGEVKESKQQLGLTVLDEPASHQSDPTVLELSLRAVNKQVLNKPQSTIGTIEQAEKHSGRIMKWISNIEEVHRKKPPIHMNYAKTMPDIESLMQVWPSEFEELLKNQDMKLPDSPEAQQQDMDCNVEEFARMVCAIMDIPVYEKVTESLHVLFTLYSEFQNHAYFQH